jgi:hypothetical protein
MSTVISEEVALQELESFVNTFVKKPVGIEMLKETYPDMLDAIVDGYLSFDEDGLPILKLKQPIKSESGNIVLSEITFKTRIKPTALASIAKGIDLKNDALTLQLKMVSYIIDQPVAMLDKFGKYDYDVINQVSTVFS